MEHYSEHHRMLGSIPGRYPLDASDIPLPDLRQPKIPPDAAMTPGRPNHPQLRTTNVLEAWAGRPVAVDWCCLRWGARLGLLRAPPLATVLPTV